VTRHPEWPNAVVRSLSRQLEAAHERIGPTLHGLTDDEYFWEPVPGCWTVHRRRSSDGAWSPDAQVFVNGRGEWVFDYAIPDLVPPPVTTIAWRMYHASSIAWVWADAVFGLGDSDWDTYDPPSTAADATRWWDRGYRRFVGSASSICDDRDLLEPMRTWWGVERTVEGWITTFLDEQVHHMAEVSLLRDLYRTSAGTGIPSA
jgi:hypothetical protein